MSVGEQDSAEVGESTGVGEAESVGVEESELHPDMISDIVNIANTLTCNMRFLNKYKTFTFPPLIL